MSEDLEAHEYHRYMTERDRLEKLVQLMDDLRDLFPNDIERINAVQQSVALEIQR